MIDSSARLDSRPPALSYDPGATTFFRRLGLLLSVTGATTSGFLMTSVPNGNVDHDGTDLFNLVRISRKVAAAELAILLMCRAHFHQHES